MFQGLIPFVVPFFDKDSNQLKKVQYQRIDLLLPHGLKGGAEAIPELAAAVLLSQSSEPPSPVEFELQLIDEGAVRLSAPLEGGMSYTLEIMDSETVEDGFG